MKNKGLVDKAHIGFAFRMYLTSLTSPLSLYYVNYFIM